MYVTLLQIVLDKVMPTVAIVLTSELGVPRAPLNFMSLTAVTDDSL